jgi:plastocyanin
MAMFLTIRAGAVVTWTNTDNEPRTVRSESITFTFDKPATYHCTCSIYPRMIVTVVVE